MITATTIGKNAVAVCQSSRAKKKPSVNLYLKRDSRELVQEFERFGAGEIIINSIDNDGQMKGFDLDLAAKVREAIHLPISVLGGAGSLTDIGSLVGACGVVGAAAGSLFVFKGQYRAVLINYPDQTRKEDIIRSGMNQWTALRK
jgi:cyclase